MANKRDDEHSLRRTETLRLLKSTPFDEKVPPVWEVFAKVLSQVPEDEIARLPVDGAAQHDHYISDVSNERP